MHVRSSCGSPTRADHDPCTHAGKARQIYNTYSTHNAMHTVRRMHTLAHKTMNIHAFVLLGYSWSSLAGRQGTTDIRHSPMLVCEQETIKSAEYHALACTCERIANQQMPQPECVFLNIWTPSRSERPSWRARAPTSTGLHFGGLGWENPSSWGKSWDCRILILVKPKGLHGLNGLCCLTSCQVLLSELIWSWGSLQFLIDVKQCRLGSCKIRWLSPL